MKTKLITVPSHLCEISKEFRFEAAHSLPFHKGKCFSQHGHSYFGKVSIFGETDNNGIVLDYYELNKIITTCVIDKYDHKDLNDIFENTTAENLAYIIFWNIQKQIEVLKTGILVNYVLIKETHSSEAIYYGK